MLMLNKKSVLDKGYVILHDVMGSDLTVVNAARCSYDKQTDKLRDKDKRLIKFLAREGHYSPFRHVLLQFEIRAPLMIARQWWKYVVGSDHTMLGWNEMSRRYVTEEPEFYVPDEWRTASKDKKQGSGEPVEDEAGKTYSEKLREFIQHGQDLYEKSLEDGITPEQARLFLPAYGMYVRWYWTASLESVIHFVKQRYAGDAQKEIQEYAKAVYHFAQSAFPESVESLMLYG